MPVSICPRCQTPIAPRMAYLRVYVRAEDDHEAYTRVHLECPTPPVDERPNLASLPKGDGGQAISGGGVEVPPSLPSLGGIGRGVVLAIAGAALKPIIVLAQRKAAQQ